MGAHRGHLLTLAQSPRGPLPLARAFEVEAAPGEDSLVVEAPAAAQDWRDAAEVAWRAARHLTGVEGRRVVVRVGGERPLAGGSSAHAVGLLVAAALLDVSLPPHFAVGHVPRDDGFLAGGMAAAPKARAAADVAATRAFPAPTPFLYPPVPKPIDPEPRLAPRRVLDVGGSLAALAPSTYARVAARHDAMRGAAGREGAFAVEVEGALLVGQDGRVWHRATPPPLDAEGHAEAVRAIARGAW